MCRRDGRVVRLTIGQYPAWSLAKARAEASRLQMEATAEVAPVATAGAADPIAIAAAPVAVALPAPVVEGVTYGQLVETYAEGHLATIRSGKNVRSSLSQACMKPHWERPAAALTRGEIQKQVDHLVRIGTPSAATNLLKAVKSMFNWAKDRELVVDNPCDGAKRRTRTTRRDRILTDAEIVAVWKGCEAPTVPRQFGDVVQLLLLTGARRNEIAQMRWCELDGNVWTLPAERSKSGRPSTLTLPPAAMTIVGRQTRHPGGEFVFSTTRGRRPSSDFSKRKRLLDAASGATDWTLHDLRRTARSKLAEIGVDREVARRILNHSADALDEIYDRFAYAEPKAEALRRLADHIEGLVGAG